MIMTTQQGQQMIVTQVPRQHHVIVNQHSGNGKSIILLDGNIKESVEQTTRIGFPLNANLPIQQQMIFFQFSSDSINYLVYTCLAGSNVIQSNPHVSSTCVISQVTTTPISSQPQIVSQMRGIISLN